jgi:class 3 adenylate cyclase
MWEEPLLARFLTRLASFSRLIQFDKRGTGMSDRVPIDRLPTLEERMEDVVAVLDAVGSTRTAIYSHSEGGNLGVLFAATYPDRTIALITSGVFAKRIWSADYPWAPHPDKRARDIEEIERDWGGTSWLSNLVPSADDDEAFKLRLARYFRRSASPSAAAALLRMNTQIDTRSILPTIKVPVLMLHRRGDRDASIEEGRWIASQIPDAKFVELPGDDHVPWVGDSDRLIDEIQEFLTGRRAPAEPDRVLATVLFTDLVGSTQRAAELGDKRWRDLLGAHNDAVRRQLRVFNGREVDTAGDGFLSTFDGPARAIRCANAISESLRPLGLQVRAGVHTGECELVDGKIRGIAVHIGARIAARAEADEIIVSSTVKDLVAGSQIEFDELGPAELKGVPGEWRLYRVKPATLIARA